MATNAVKDQNNISSILGVSSVDGVTPIPVQVDPVTGAIKISLTGGSPGTLGGLTDVSLGTLTNGQALVYSSSLGKWVNSTISGSGSPGGANTNIQFNDSGAFGGNAGLTYNKTTFAVGLTGVITQTISGTPTTLTNPTLQATNSVNNYTQISIQNKSAGVSASSDHIAYPDNNTNDLTGFIDNGITSSVFSDANYIVTGANEGYTFVSAPSGSGKTGNYIIATDSTGTANEILFFTGGFNSLNNERMRIKSTGVSFGKAGVSNGTIILNGQTSGAINLVATQIASGTITIPSATGTMTVLGNTTTGSGNIVLATSPTLVTPLLGIPTSGTLTNCTGLPLTTGVTGILPTANGGTGVTTSTGANSNVLRDANQNIVANNMNEGYQTIVTASGTTTLTIASPFHNFFTGTLPQTIVLPNATTLSLAWQFRIHSNSSGVVTIQTNGGATLWTMASGTDIVVTVTDISTSAGIWDIQYLGVVAVSGKKVSVSNSINIAGTDSTTMTFPSTSATIARTDAGQTFTGVQVMASPQFTTPQFSSIVNTGTLTLPTTTDTLVGRLTTDTLINKTLTKPTLNAFTNAVTADTDGATITFDMSASNIHTVTLAGNRTLAVSNVSVGQCFILRLTQDATGSRTVTWFTTLKWAGGSAPTLTTTATKTDLIGFLCTSSGNYDAFVIAQNI